MPDNTLVIVAVATVGAFLLGLCSRVAARACGVAMLVAAAILAALLIFKPENTSLSLPSPKIDLHLT